MINHDRTPACRMFLNRLGVFLDDEIPGDERAEIARHLSGCASCRAEMRLQDVISSAIRRRFRPGGPETIRARLVEEAKRDAGAASRSTQQVRRIIYETDGARVVRFESPALNQYHPASATPDSLSAYRRIEYREAVPGGRRITRTVRTG